MPRPRKPKRFDDYNDILTVDEVAELLQIERKTAYAHVRSGEIPAWRIGRSIRISKDIIRERLSRPMEGSNVA